MDIAEVLTLADELIFAKTGKHLDYVQEAILRGTLQDATYTQIAQEVYSSPSHVRNVGSDLWKTLSKGLKKNITKNNFRTVLEKASFYNYQLAIVENVTGENITVNHNVNICHEKARSPTSPQNPQPTAKQPRIDLDDAPEISTFFDRTSEISTLKQWILENRTRLISILGLSGIGKSAIALQLIQHIQYEFDCIIWRSLRDAPPLQTLQTDLIKFLSQQQETNPPNPPLSRGGEEIKPPSPRGGEEIKPPSPRGGRRDSTSVSPPKLGGVGGGNRLFTIAPLSHHPRWRANNLQQRTTSRKLQTRLWKLWHFLQTNSRIMSQQLHSFAQLGKTQRNCSIRRRSQKLSNIATQ